MKIHAITVCVDYTEFLAQSIERWMQADSLTVITSLTDTDTHNLCAKNAGITEYRTKAFYEYGAHFNKGAAIANCVRELCVSNWGPKDWVLFFDADIIPPVNWKERVEMCDPQFGHIYGAWRMDEKGNRIADTYPAGYFLLFHSQDPNAKHDPIVDDCWMHAGNYDTTFISRWQRHQLHWLPSIMVSHVGTPGLNWCGRGNTKAMNDVVAERRKRRDWRHETINKK